MFNVIPVIDLYNGVVVHAKHGQRAHYQPIQSQLTPSHHAVDVVHALYALYPFTTLYIADLDAIMHGHQRNRETIEQIQATFPKLTIWLDAGKQNNEAIKALKQRNIQSVLGTESIARLQDYSAFNIPETDAILSLDFMPDGYAGPTALLETATYWPDHVIVMTLANVGSGLGLDIKRLTQILALRTTQQVYAAGGVRNIEDCRQLKQMGVNGVLVASALHQKRINAADLTALMSANTQ